MGESARPARDGLSGDARRTVRPAVAAGRTAIRSEDGRDHAAPVPAAGIIAPHNARDPGTGDVRIALHTYLLVCKERIRRRPMARRTKAEAEETRQKILDAAERLFFIDGVSRTSLEHIATAAGVTRGAIYWHFKNKLELFEALHERVK